MSSDELPEGSPKPLTKKQLDARAVYEFLGLLNSYQGSPIIKRSGKARSDKPLNNRKHAHESKVKRKMAAKSRKINRGKK